MKNKIVKTSRTQPDQVLITTSIELRERGYPPCIRQAIVESLKKTQILQGHHEQELPAAPQQKLKRSFESDSWLEIPYSFRFY